MQLVRFRGCTASVRPRLGARRSLFLTILLSAATLLVPGVHAQGTPPPAVNITPPPGSVMVTQTVNSVFVQVGNADLFTNLMVNLQPPFGPLPFLDDGNPPDAAAGDFTFSGDVPIPALPASTNVTLTFITQGLDLSATNDAGEVDPDALVFATNSVDYIVVVRPPNDNFTNAIKVPSIGELIITTNNWASLEPGEPAHADIQDGDASIWWNWSTPYATNVLVDTAGSSFDPIVSVYRGGALDSLEPVASSTFDAERNLLANVTFPAEAGITYRIAVSSHSADEVGDVRLRIAPGWLPDELEPVVTILAPGSETLVDQPEVLLSGTAKDSLPFPSGLLRVEVDAGGSPVVADGLENWSARLTLSPGTNILKAVAYDYAGHASAPHTLVIRYMNPTNDMFASAIRLTELGGTVTAVTERATREEGEPFHGGNEGGHSIWYSFLAPATGLLTLSTTNSNFDTLLGLYQGDTLTNLTVVALNDDAAPRSGYSELTSGLESGQLYYIAVDGYGGEFGDVSLTYAFATTEDYFSLNYGTLLGGTADAAAGLYVAGSTLVINALPARDFVFEGWEGTVVSSENPLVLVMDQNYFLRPKFRVISYTDNFETGDFSTLGWTFEGDAEWTVQSHTTRAGRFSASSGSILDGQYSSLVLSAPMLAGTGSFDFQVSSEKGWDVLEFFVNGVPQGRWSGHLPWRTFLFNVPEGENRLEWRYTKDANFSNGQDAAFLDNFYIPVTDAALAPRLNISWLSSLYDVQVTVRGRPGRSYILQTSPDLRNWSNAYTNSTPEGSWVWHDPNPPVEGSRFYRAVLE